MSPVEFSNYIKQRTTMNPPPFMQSPNAMMGHNLKPLMSPSRSISPATAHTAPALSINSDPFYYHHNNGYYGHQAQQQQQPQPYLGSHHHMGYGSAAALTGASMVGTSPSANAISSSISSISSASSSSASSSVSSSSLGDHLLFGSQFGSNAGNRLSGQMYNFYPSSTAAAAESPFVDNFFTPAALASQFEDGDLVEGNPTKFGVIGGGLSGQVGAGMGQEVLEGELNGGASNDSNNNGEDSSGNGSPNPNSGNSLDNLQANTFYSGSSGSPFPQLLVAN
jgi:hypothetical protein